MTNGSLILILVQRFPFDWDNLRGYLVAVILQHGFLIYEYVIIACSFALLFGVYRIVLSATKEIKRILHSMNEEAQTKGNQLKILLSEYIDVHTAIKQLSKNS